MKMTSFSVQEEMIEKLKEQAKKEERSMASLMRYLIGDYLQEVKTKEERIQRVFKRK